MVTVNGSAIVGGQQYPCSASILLPPAGIPGRWAVDLNASGADISAWLWLKDNVTASTTPGSWSVDSGKVLSLTTSGVPGNRASFSTGQTGGSTGFYGHGAWECKLQLPAATGGGIAMHPAFWLLGQGAWPSAGEYDLMEGTNGTDYASYWFNPQPYPAMPDKESGSMTTYPLPPASGAYSATKVTPSFPSPNVADGNWHTVGCNWLAGRMDVYKDGALYCTFAALQSDQPARPVVSIATLDSYTGAAIPATLKVAYIRHWAPA